MNLKNGFIRLSLVLTVIVGAYGYFFNNVYIWDEGRYVQLKEAALLEKHNANCSQHSVYSVTELGSNRVVFFVGTSNKNGEAGKNDNFPATVFDRSKCTNILILVEHQRLETPILISNITDEMIANYVLAYRSDSLSAYIKSQVNAVFEAVAYLWMTIALLSAMFYALRWVYKGFKNYDK